MTNIGNGNITIGDFIDVLYKDSKVTISPESLKRVEQSFAFLKKFSQDKVIYGINTGFGPMAQYKIENSDQKQLQYNLIRSHAAGSGQHIPSIYIKSALLVLLNNLLQGFSGVHPDAVNQLAGFINKRIVPYVPEHGGVGASGDLVQLAHIALNLIGEGDVFHNNKLSACAAVLKKNDLKPLQMYIREGLALMNGTSVMTGISIVNVVHARRLLGWLLVSSALINEIVQSFDDHFSEELNRVKRHHGQQIIAQHMRDLIGGSKMIKDRENGFYLKKIDECKIRKRVQEYYSVRCTPQIMGPVYDAIEHAEKLFLNEANSVHDNPVIDVEANNVFHGGNFHGDYISYESDKLKIGVTKLTMVAERQLNFLMNNKLNKILPPFVNLGKLGFNLGMQGVQFTATSTTAENQTLSFPMYVHSIPNNNDNQDIVSMGTNSALMTKKVIDNGFQVISIELLSLLQAVDYLACEKKLAPKTRKIYQTLRAIVPKFIEDAPKYKDVDALKNFIKEKCFKDLF
jgi:histidine ammonia-lyase